MIDTQCPHCRTPYRLKPEFAGRQVRCRVCQTTFDVVEPDIADEDLVSIEMPTPRPRVSPTLPASNRPSGKPVRKGPRVDELGFFTEFDDDDDHRHQSAGVVAEEEDEEERLFREAARRGAEALYEPRKPKKKSAVRNGRSSTTNASSVLIKLVLGLAGIVGAGILIYIGIHSIANAGIRLALSGQPYEIRAEFEQSGDTAIGSPAPAEARIDRSLPVRDLSKHREILRQLVADFNGMADAFAQITDAQSAEAQSPRIEEISQRLSSLQQRIRTEKIFNPNPKEDQILAKEFGKALKAGGDRMRDQLVRIQSMSRFPGAMGASMAQVNMGLSQMERQFVAKGELPDFEKYAELRVAGLKNSEEREYINELIRELATPRTIRTKTNSMAATRYALWPVDSPSALAKKIAFGKVIRTTGKEIWVVAHPIDPQVLKERREKREAEALERKKQQDESKARSEEIAAESRKAQGEVDIPAGADDITKGLLISTRSNNTFKRRDGLRLLKVTPLGDRTDEVLEAMAGLLDDTDTFILDDVLSVIKRCDSPKRLDVLHQALKNASLREKVMEYLATIKDPSSIEPMVDALNPSPFDKGKEFIVAFGPAAEDAVIKKLAHPNEFVRASACEILGVIGSDKTLSVMKGLAPDSSFRVREAAKSTVTAIVNRKKINGEPLKNDESPRKYETTASGLIRIGPNSNGKSKSSQSPKSGSNP